jgi:Zn-dependent peptidase ImmA (M78 family)
MSDDPEIRDLVRSLKHLQATYTDDLREVRHYRHKLEQDVAHLDEQIAKRLETLGILEARVAEIAAKQYRTAEDLDKIESIRTSDRRMMSDADIMALRGRK